MLLYRKLYENKFSLMTCKAEALLETICKVSGMKWKKQQQREGLF